MRYLILGTNTEIGKTHFCGLFVKHLKDKGRRVKYVKPIQTGYPKDDDASFVKRFANLKDDEAITIIKEEKPVAAAALFDKFPMDDVCSKIEKISEFDDLIIETAGGAFSPLDKTLLNYHFAKFLNLEVILVVPNRLGCISEAISNYRLLKYEGVSVYAIVMNNYFSHTKDQKNLELINRFCDDKVKIVFDKDKLTYIE